MQYSLIEGMFVMEAYINNKSYEKCRSKIWIRFLGVQFLRNQACLRGERDPF